MSEYARLSVNISDDAAAFLRAYMSSHGVNATETVRRAIAVLKFVDDEIRAGSEIAVRDRSGQTRVVKMLS